MLRGFFLGISLWSLGLDQILKLTIESGKLSFFFNHFLQHDKRKLLKQTDEEVALLQLNLSLYNAMVQLITTRKLIKSNLMPGRRNISGMISVRVSVSTPGTEVLGEREEVSIRGSRVSERLRVATSDQGPAPPFSSARTWGVGCCF